MKGRRIRTTLAAATITAAMPGVAQAVRVDYMVDAGYEHDDNVTLSEVDPVEQYIGRLGLGFAVEQASSTVQASVIGRLDYRHYEDIYDDNTDRMLQGRLNWNILPERLSFVVEDSYGIQTINRFNPDSPDNRQQVNVLSLGPTLDFGVSRRFVGAADLRYVNSDAEITEDFNSDRYLGALRLVRAIDPTSSFSYNLQAQRIDFDNDDVARDHDRVELFASYRRAYPRFDLLVDVGYAHLDYDDGQSLGRPLVRAQFGWNYTERSRFSIALADQFSDAASSSLDAIDTTTGVPTSVVTGDTTVTASAYEQRSVMAEYAFEGTRMSFSAYGQLADLDYVDSDVSNEDNRNLGVSLRYRLRPTVTLGASASIDRTDYEAPADRRETNRLYTASIEKQWSRHWSSALTYTHYERSSSVALGGFDQNVVYLSLAYRNR